MRDKAIPDRDLLMAERVQEQRLQESPEIETRVTNRGRRSSSIGRSLQPGPCGPKTHE